MFYVANRGHKTKTAQKFGVTRETIRLLSVKHWWDADIPTIEAATRELSNRTVAEARAVAVTAIDKYLDKQLEFIRDDKIRCPESTTDGFNPEGAEKMVKTRELLTGGDTERVDLGIDKFLEVWSKLDPTERRERLARARSRRSAS